MAFLLNKFVINSFRDAIALSLTNCFTSVVAGFVVFSVLGHMAFKSGISIEKVAAQGMFDTCTVPFL